MGIKNVVDIEILMVGSLHIYFSKIKLVGRILHCLGINLLILLVLAVIITYLIVYKLSNTYGSLSFHLCFLL